MSTRHPFWAQHECLPAYVFAAELHERGEDNVYHARHYPGLNPEAEPEVMIPLSAVGSVLLFGLFGWALLRPLARHVEEPFSLRRWQPSPG